MSRKPRVALIGAGIGGLTAAIALRQRRQSRGGSAYNSPKEV